MPGRFQGCSIILNSTHSADLILRGRSIAVFWSTDPSVHTPLSPLPQWLCKGTTRNKVIHRVSHFLSPFMPNRPHCHCIGQGQRCVWRKLDQQLGSKECYELLHGCRYIFAPPKIYPVVPLAENMVHIEQSECFFVFRGYTKGRKDGWTKTHFNILLDILYYVHLHRNFIRDFSLDKSFLNILPDCDSPSWQYKRILCNLGQFNSPLLG